MAIEFREVRRGEIDDALAFAAAQGGAVERAQLDAHLSLVARNSEQTILGSALHHRDDLGRRHIVVHLQDKIHPGLARLLADRALGKAEAKGIATAHLNIAHAEAEALAWSSSDWLARLTPKPTKPSASSSPPTPDKTNTTPQDPTDETAVAAVAAESEPPPTTPDTPASPPETLAQESAAGPETPATSAASAA